MKITRWRDAEPLPTEFEARKLIGTEQAELIRFALLPHARIPPHGNDVDVIFHVLAGAGTTTIDGKATPLGEGDTIFIERDTQREWTAAKSGITLLAVKLR